MHDAISASDNRQSQQDAVQYSPSLISSGPVPVVEVRPNNKRVVFGWWCHLNLLRRNESNWSRRQKVSERR